MVPEASQKDPDGRRFRWGAAVAAVLLGLWYISWRLTATLNWEDPAALTVSIVLFTAELYGFAALLLFFFQTGKGPYRKAPVLPTVPTVDVFVTICNESVDVLYRTLVCCRAMEYPRGAMTVCVLDDGNRSEVRELAEAMGCRYLTRPDRTFAKAGNLNHALTQTGGEIVAVFDCDHIPVRSFLMETVGFFADPKVAIVQTPHFFHNPDSFQRNLRLERELANEQDLFFRVIEPARDRYNAAFFAGSSGLFRRSALQEIGGFQTL
ncbi:MAG: glycosyltransferase, partial [Nitrospirae bacterium]|nr:glycosyltransferase [Nitrospirota bacterium]